MASVLKFDALNRLEYQRMFNDCEAQIRKVWYEHIGMDDQARTLEDTLYDLLLFAYSLGISDTDTDLSAERALSGSKLTSGF